MALVPLNNVEVFRAGDYGDGEVYSPADVERIAASYDPALLPAPVTLDHEHRGQAYGWVRALRAENGTLYADLSVDEEFDAELKSGRWMTRSVELIVDTAAYFHGFGQEVAGIYFRAVSFLGAASPRVKGMAPVYQLFAEDALSEGVRRYAQREVIQEGYTNQEVAMTTHESNAGQPLDMKEAEGFLKKLASFFRSVEYKEDDEGADEEPTAPDNHEETLMDKIREMEERMNVILSENARLKAEIDQMREKDKESYEEREADKFAAAFDAAVAAGKAAPATRDAMLAVFTAIPAEGDYGEDHPRAKLLATFSSGASVVQTGVDADVAEESANATAEKVDRFAQIKAFQKQHQIADYSEARERYLDEHPEAREEAV